MIRDSNSAKAKCQGCAYLKEQVSDLVDKVSEQGRELSAAHDKAQALNKTLAERYEEKFQAQMQLGNFSSLQTEIFTDLDDIAVRFAKLEEKIQRNLAGLAQPQGLLRSNLHVHHFAGLQVERATLA